MFDALFDPILPVFALLAVGFGLGRAGQVDIADARLINRQAMTLFLPVLIFGLLANAPIEAFEPAPLLVYAGAELLLFAAGFALARKLLCRPGPEALLLAFCGMFANNALFILPISLYLYGAEGALPVLSIVTLDSTLAFCGSMIALDLMTGGKVSGPKALARVLRLPIVLAMLGGLALALSGFTLPAPVQTFLDFTGAAAAPMALFAMGVVLSRTAFAPTPAVVLFSFNKLVVFPVAVWAGLALFAAQSATGSSYLLASAGPSGTMAFSMALLYNQPTGEISQIIVWTSVGTLFLLAVLA
ncbi:MAG: AEC family transporter [Pseudomonadota bacterium]